MMIVQINFSVKLLINFAAYSVDHADSLSLRSNGHFPGEPGLAGVYCLLKQRMMEVVVTTEE